MGRYTLREQMILIKIDELSKNQLRYVRAAAAEASVSTYGNFRHGAVLIAGGKLINAGHNKPNHCSFAKRFRSAPGDASTHAEIDCVYHVPNEKLTGSTMYAVRVAADGSFKMSRPCDMCYDVLKFCGVARVYYSVDSGTMMLEKIK